MHSFLRLPLSQAAGYATAYVSLYGGLFGCRFWNNSFDHLMPGRLPYSQLRDFALKGRRGYDWLGRLLILMCWIGSLELQYPTPSPTKCHLWPAPAVISCFPVQCKGFSCTWRVKDSCQAAF